MHSDDFSLEALYRRYDTRVRYVAGWTIYARRLDFDSCVAAGHDGVRAAARRYTDPSRPPPATPFDVAVWGYIRNAIARACRKQLPALADDAEHECSVELLERRALNPADDDPLQGSLLLLEQLHSARLLEMRTDPDDCCAEEELTPEQRVEESQAHDKIAMAVGSLIPSEREIILEHVWEQLTFAQIAEERDTDVRWIKRLYQRALSNIKDGLAAMSTARKMIR